MRTGTSGHILLANTKVSARLCYSHAQTFSLGAYNVGYTSSLPYTARRMRHRVDRGYYGLLSEHVANSTTDPVCLEAAAALKESRSMEPFFPRLFKLTKQKPYEQIPWHLLVSGHISNPEGLMTIYWEAKSRRATFPGLLNTIVDFLIRINGDFEGAFEIFRDNNVQIARIERFIDLAKDGQSLNKLWNVIISKKEFKASDSPQRSVAIYAYTRALARISFVEARNFAVTVSSKNKNVNSWIGLLEAVGESKETSHLYETFCLSTEHKIPFEKISRKLFEALALIRPRLVYAAFKGESVTVYETKGKELFSLINTINISNVYRRPKESVWKIPLMGFLCNALWLDAKEVILHAERAYDENFQTLYHLYFDYARKHAPVKICLDLLRLLQEKKLVSNDMYSRQIRSFRERGFTEAIFRVEEIQHSYTEPDCLRSNADRLLSRIVSTYKN